MSDINEELNSLTLSQCNNNKCPYNHVVNTEDVKSAVQFLKANKSDGITGHNSNHLIYGTDLFYSILAELFTSMLHHGYAEPSFRLSVIIPIVKNKKSSLNSSSNYRGIALSSLLAKVMDIIIMKTHKLYYKVQIINLATNLTYQPHSVILS